MYLSDCCGATFPEPGYPDTDLCGQCHEHTGAYKEDENRHTHRTYDEYDSYSSNINLQYVIDRLNNLELTGRNKKELCEIVDVLSEIQRQIYATGVALNQTTKE